MIYRFLGPINKIFTKCVTHVAACANFGVHSSSLLKCTMQTYNSRSRIAFTLAEVLITLGILGVVAAMTMPTLNQKLKDQSNISMIKKTYSILQQATNMVIADYESPEYWGMVDNNENVVADIYSRYRTHFNMMRECANSDGCWGYPTKYLNNTIYWSEHNDSWCQYAFTLVTGVNVLMDIYPDEQLRNNFGIDVDYHCLVFWIDINADKLPNTIGRDIFAFVVTHRGLQPAGLKDISQCSRENSGFPCSGKIIHDGWKIKY